MTFKNINNLCCRFTDRLKRCTDNSDCRNHAGPLSKRRHGGRLRICRITGDRRLCARMTAMGVYPGMEAELICPENGGQCILKIHDRSICLDSSISANILVSSV